MSIDGGVGGGAIGAISRPMQLATPVIIARPRPPSSVGGAANTVARYEPAWYRKLIKSMPPPPAHPGASQPLTNANGMPNRPTNPGYIVPPRQIDFVNPVPIVPPRQVNFPQSGN
jgi:hypothetical protein